MKCVVEGTVLDAYGSQSGKNVIIKVYDEFSRTLITIMAPPNTPYAELKGQTKSFEVSFKVNSGWLVDNSNINKVTLNAS